MQERRDLHGGLTRAWALVEEVRQELLTTIRPLSDAQWAYRSTARTWCVGEIAEHLLLGEIGSSKMVRKLIRGDYQNVPFPKHASLYGVELDRYPYGSLDAPQVLLPGPLRPRAELESALAAAHERFRLELAQFRGDDSEALRSPDPATGEWFTLGGWVRLQAWHEKHHVGRIHRLMDTPGFP